MPTKVSDDEFIKAWRASHSPEQVAKDLGLTVRGLYSRRKRLEKRGIVLATMRVDGRQTTYSPPAHFERTRHFSVPDGTVVIFSDPHWLPDHDTLAQDALEAVITEVRPLLVICGGDAVDGDTISRWDPTRGHRKRFTVREELDCVVEHFAALDKVCGKAQKAWCMGNHDLRLSRFVATRAPELLDLPHTRLEDWVPGWPLSWTVSINDGKPGFTVVRHRNQAGMLHLQAMRASCHYAHGHLHRLNVHTAATFAGPRYSIDCGSLADPVSDGFDYMEGGAPHVQGFAVLTFKAGKLLPPELCTIQDQVAYFRGRAV